MRRRLATTAFAVLALVSAGALGAGWFGQDLDATTLSDPPGAAVLVWLRVGSVEARALPRADRGTMTTYAYLEREGVDASGHRVRDSRPGALLLGESQPAPAATDYALVPGSASPGRASPVPAIAVLFASTLGGLGVFLCRQQLGRREA
jgi:hypothetical protein